MYLFFFADIYAFGNLDDTDKKSIRNNRYFSQIDQVAKKTVSINIYVNELDKRYPTVKYNTIYISVRGSSTRLIAIVRSANKLIAFFSHVNAI